MSDDENVSPEVVAFVERLLSDWADDELLIAQEWKVTEAESQAIYDGITNRKADWAALRESKAVTDDTLDRITDELRKKWAYIDIDGWHGEPRPDHRTEWRRLIADVLEAARRVSAPDP